MQQEQQPGARRVRVLTGSNKGSTTQPYPPPLKHASSSPSTSSSFSASKPLKARVDPSAFATPILRRTPSSQSTTPIARPRAQVTPGLAAHSAPSPPLGSPFSRAATVTSPRIVQRPPSPVRARPGLNAGGGVYKSGGGGGQDSWEDRKYATTFPTTITHLPASVSTRTLHTPSSHAPSHVPPLSASSSSGSSTPSPLTSPNANSSYEFPSPSLGAPSRLVPRTSGAGDGLLPAHAIASGTGFPATYAYRSPSPVPLNSPSTAGPPQRKNTRPPSTTSTTASRHTRSMSVTSSSSISSVVSSQEEASRAQVRAPSAAGFLGKGKLREDAGGEVGDGGGAERAIWLALEEERKASEEREQEARVARKILDLEITTNSLLTINASLERLKVLQATEIRDLRKRLRESRTLVPLSSGALITDEGLESGDDSSTASGEEDDEKEATWEELLQEDQRFAGVAVVLETLLRRGKEAIAFKPTVLEGGRVLHQVEIEESWEEGEGEGGGEAEAERDEGRGDMYARGALPD